MLPMPIWLRRAAPAATALILPDGRAWSFADLAGMPGRTGLQVLAGDAAALARGLVESARGGGTALLLPPGLDPAQRESLLALAAQAAKPELALIVATSGSSGAPKGVRLPWRAVAAASRMIAHRQHGLDLRAGDAWLACLPLHHVGGAMIIYRCLRAGATAVVHDGFDAAAVARDLAAQRITHLSLVPAMLARLLDAAVPPAPTLRCVLVGGAALTPALFERAVAAGWPVRLSYGMTETCATALVDGQPLPGVRVRTDTAGRLAIATPARMAGYLGEAGPPPEWIATNDLGTVDAQGHAHIDGRADDMLVSAGVNVHPLEVEARLAACPGVREAGVTGLADPVWGDVIAAAYEGDAHEAALDDWCRTHLPNARRPRRFLRVERLPRLASGKLDRRALPALWETRP
jgi:O-succinylbenzoic acid--CoA ligase